MKRLPKRYVFRLNEATDRFYIPERQKQELWLQFEMQEWSSVHNFLVHLYRHFASIRFSDLASILL
jgi:hypothetical protein